MISRLPEFPLANVLLNLEFPALSAHFVVGILINFVSIWILIRQIYYRSYKKNELFLTFFVFNGVIFMTTYLLNKVEMSMGAAFGLFDVFSVLRYRTEGISAKDMTYLFLVIAMGLISAISRDNYTELLVFNVFILSMTFVLESSIVTRKELSKTINYDNIKLITPECRAELLEDLGKRTGFPVHRVEILEIDFLKDATTMTIYYYEK